VERVRFEYNGTDTLTATIQDAVVGRRYTLSFYGGDGGASSGTYTALSGTVEMEATDIAPDTAYFTFEAVVYNDDTSEYYGAAVFRTDGAQDPYVLDATWDYDGDQTVSVTAIVPAGLDFGLETDGISGYESDTTATGTGVSQTFEFTLPSPPEGRFYAGLVTYDGAGYQSYANRLFDAGEAGAGYGLGVQVAPMECDEIDLGAPSGTLYAMTFRYAPDIESVLHTVNVETGEMTEVGAAGGVDIIGIAYDRTTGTMFGIGDDDNLSLFTISLGTGEATEVGSLGHEYLADLACSASGRLYGFDGNDETGVWLINKTTGEATSIADDYPSDYHPNTALAFDGDGVLWGYDNSLYVFDPVTGETTLVGEGSLQLPTAASADSMGVVWVLAQDDLFDPTEATLYTAELPSPVASGGDPVFAEVVVLSDPEAFCLEWVFEEGVGGAMECDELTSSAMTCDASSATAKTCATATAAASVCDTVSASAMTCD